MLLRKSRGCEVVKRTRRMPGTSPTLSSSVGEIPAGRRRIAIAVHVLPQQLNFAIPARASSPRFRHHRRAGAAALGTARERHHAIGARFVAAFDDREVRPVRIVAAGNGRLEGILGVEAQSGDAAVAGFELNQKLAEARL